MHILTTQEQARQQAIDWQNNCEQHNYSMLELANYQAYFTKLAHKFVLVDEFTENGII
jgi:hypothetical protein